MGREWTVMGIGEALSRSRETRVGARAHTTELSVERSSLGAKARKRRNFLRQLVSALLLCSLSLVGAVGAELDGPANPRRPQPFFTDHDLPLALADSIPGLHSGRVKHGKDVSIDLREGTKESSLNVLYKPAASVDVRARYYEKQADGSLGSFDEGERVGACNLRVDYAAMGDRLVLYGETDLSDVAPRSAGGVTWRDRHGINAGFKGRRGDFSYGASVGARAGGHRWMSKRSKFHSELGTVSLGSGKQGGEAWGRWSLGRLSVRGSLSRFSDHWRRSRNKDAVVHSERKAGIELRTRIFDQPYVGVATSYYRGKRESRSTGPHGLELGNAFHDLRGNLSIRGKKNGASLSSSVQWNDAAENPTNNPTLKSSHTLSATHRPMDGLSLGSQVGFSRYGYEQSGVRGRRRHASLSLNYAPNREDFHFSAHGRYATHRNVAWSQKRRKMHLRTSIESRLRRPPVRDGRLSLNLTYDRLSDLLSPGFSRENVSIWLLFRAGTPSQRLALSGIDSSVSAATY